MLNQLVFVVVKMSWICFAIKNAKEKVTIDKVESIWCEYVRLTDSAHFMEKIHPKREELCGDTAV